VFTIEKTSTNGFCHSCHEMDIAFAEYERSVHFRNATGVTATCSDCHIPQHSWPAKVVRKTQAGWTDVVGKLAGTISTPEKYEAHRKELAEKVWTSMKANDSRECRGCHDRAAMLPDAQSKMAQRSHKKAVEQGLTCIECHQGVAHNLPRSRVRRARRRNRRRRRNNRPRRNRNPRRNDCAREHEMTTDRLSCRTGTDP
jgi:cytochrome c-type protein NapC